MAKTRTRIIKVGVLLAALVLIGMALLSLRTIRSFSATSERVLHTHEVRDALQQILGLMRDSETGSRGFILTGNDEFLEPHEEGAAQLDESLARLRALLADNALQVERMEVLVPLVRKKNAQIHEGVRLRRQEGAAAAAGWVATAEGKHLMDQIRRVVADMQAEEDRLLAARLGVARREASRTVAALVVGLSMDGILIVAVILLIRNDWRAREAAAGALRRSADEIRDLYNRAPCGYHSLAADGTFTAINDTELSWLGYRREEVVGRLKITDRLTPASRDRFAEAFPRFKQTGTITDMEYELVRRDGSILPVVLNATAIRDEAGHYVSSRSTIFDNTERKRAELISAQARAYAESIVETVRDPLIILTQDLRVNSANRAYYEAFATTADATVGRSFQELNGGIWARPDLLAALADVVPGQTRLDDFELIIPGSGPDQPGNFFRLNARKLHRPGNHTTMLLLAIDDLTARRQAEIELDRFFTLSLDFLCIAGADGYFKRASPAVTDILGWSVAEFLARPYMELVHPDDRAATAREVERQVKAGEKVQHFENRYRHKDGSWRMLAWRSVPQPDGLMYATARDVTEFQRLNLELRQRAAQLEAANKELEAFSYSVSHDLRAPLRHIDGFAQLLQKHAGASLDATGKRHLATISSAAKNLGTLIDELLLFCRMGRAELRAAELDMSRLVDECVQALQPDILERSIVWRIGALPVVQADAAMLRQVWINLLGNAVKYTRHQPAACIEITHRTDPRDGHVFSVRDNGAGFDMQYADKLFGVFQRLHGASEFEGTGIGLANVQRIILRHGGRVWAEGIVGEGATFYFSLPSFHPVPAGSAAPLSHE